MKIQCTKCNQHHNDEIFPLLELAKYLGRENSLTCINCIKSKRLSRKLLHTARKMSNRQRNSIQEIRRLQLLLKANQVTVFDFPLQQAKRTTNYLNKTLLRDYGISIHQYEQLLEKQNWQCAICGKQFPNKLDLYLELEKLPVVDHDHRTNVIRGILCGSHNSGLGFFQDSPELLRKAARYIEQHSHSLIKTKLPYSVRKLITEQKQDAFNDNIHIQKT